MNRMFFLIIISILFSCKSPSQENKNSFNKSGIENNFKESFDKKDEILYGFDSSTIAEINNKMSDDVKVLLAEYRRALKKYKSEREI